MLLPSLLKILALAARKCSESGVERHHDQVYGLLHPGKSFSLSPLLQESQLLELRLERDQAAARACRLQLRMECILGQAGAADETVAATLAGAAAAGAGTEASHATAARQLPRGKAAGRHLSCTCLLGLGSRPDMPADVHSAWQRHSGRSQPFPETMSARDTGWRLECTSQLGLHTSCWP